MINLPTHFGVTEEIINKTLSAALETGADYADLYFEHTADFGISLLDNIVNAASSDIDFGVGVRVVIGSQTGYAYSEDISEKALLNAARMASRIAKSSTLSSAQSFNVSSVAKNQKVYSLDSEQKTSLVESSKPFLDVANDLVFAADPRVSKVAVRFNSSKSHIFFVNSLGESFYDYRPLSSFVVRCVMQENGRSEANVSSRSFRIGDGFLTDELVREVCEEVVDKTKLLFNAIQPKGGEMPVVMGAGGSGILLHEAIGHAFEADFIRNNTSIFADKLGCKVSHESINVVDDATLLNNRGSLNFDDEGVEGQKTYIVKDGVLNSFLHDRISAKHFGVSSTGNGRRQNFRFAPVPRMRATYMEDGDTKEEDIIASIKQGVFVDSFSNGQVQIGAGDFTFFVKSGYLIENGRLTQPIKDINVIGNGPKALANISMIANNSKIDNGTWNCGKDGQDAPVTCGMPSVLVSNLIVG